MSKLAKDGKQLLSSAIVFLVLDAVAVGLRLVAKSKTKNRFALDDLFMLLTLALFAAWAGVVIASVINIAGTYDVKALPAPAAQLGEIYKLLYIAELLFISGITLAKVTILTWYRSIFTTGKIRRIKDLVLILCMIWWIAMSVAVAVQCVPLREAWDPLRSTGTPTPCVRFGIFTLMEELTNIILDIMILILPISVIRDLKLPARQRWSLSLIFLMGGFVCITSIVKIRYCFSPKEPIQSEFHKALDRAALTPTPVYSTSLCIVWSNTGFGTAIVCACLPTYRPLFRNSRFGDWMASATHGVRKTGSGAVVKNPSQNAYEAAQSGHSRFIDDTNSDQIPLNEVTGTRSNENNKVRRIPLNAIAVERRIEVL